MMAVLIILLTLFMIYHDFKFVDLQVNRGKANALNEGVKQASYDYVMCLDADTIVDQDAPYYMMNNFKKNPKLGAVTGNPRIRNKRVLYAADVLNAVNHWLARLTPFQVCLHYLRKAH